MNPIKALFCDVDGVLVKEEARFSIKYSQEFGVPVEILNSYLDYDFDLCLTGKDDLKERLPELFESWKWTGTVDELINYWFGMDLPPHSKLIDFVNTAKKGGIKVYLATQNEKYRTAKFIEILKPLLNYDETLSTCTIGYKKSNPEYFINCLKICGFKPEETVLIDNSEKAINAAKSVGINTVFFTEETQAIIDLANLLESK